jgi:hypothetical protein
VGGNGASWGRGGRHEKNTHSVDIRGELDNEGTE